MVKPNPLLTDDRPLSPHLTIYKPQISSVLSILHRLTGVALYVGLVTLAFGIFCRVYFSQGVMVEWVNNGLVKGILFLWVVALYYHLFSGIRHLFWDMGKGYSLPVMHRTGWLVVIATVLSSALTWVLVIQ